jgi:formylmethanofuran dehydrogenase subunit E
MATLNQLLELSRVGHNHLCPRQVLGVRMGMLAAQILELELPQSNKRLMVWIETDGCFVDGVRASTGCSIGRRTLRHMDYGKIAATFVDTIEGQAVRISPHPDSREKVKQYAPNASSRWHQYLDGYQVMPYEELFVVQSVTLNFSLKADISHPNARVICTHCGEEIINDRQIVHNNVILCRACIDNPYYLAATAKE